MATKSKIFGAVLVSMKVVLGWLNEHLDAPLSVKEAVGALERAGIEVEEVINPPQFDSKIVTATVASVKPHPNADRLQLAVVRSGDKEYQVVCGAPNLKPGQRVVFAAVGSVLPDGLEIAETKIRGQDSFGMLCSEKELGLGGDHDGLLDLGPEVATDLPLHEVFGADNTVIDVKTAANRWDLQSYQGIAREVAAHTGVRLLEDRVTQGSVKAERVNSLFNNKLQAEVPCYGLMRLSLKQGVGSSPLWMQRYLRLHGFRPVNAVVDITNYAMCETGQPMHAFDIDKISNQINIRFANDGEAITTLDGVKRSLGNDDLVIADDNGPVALAGVIGGENSEITDSTREILLEAATFESVLVRKSAKRHGVRTEASARFERGLPLPAVRQAMRYALHLLEEHAGAELLSYQNELTAWPWVQHIGVRTSRVNTLLGQEVTPEDIVDNLKKLDFDVESFDIASQARKHLGKPYKLGARFRTDGVEAFDCSYLVDYLYSLIGVKIGHTAHGQYRSGEAVGVDDLRPGDLLFRGGPWVELDETEREGVSHVAIYVGDQTIVDARDYVRNKEGEWEELPSEEQGVVELPLASITEDPQFLGARRYVDNLEDYIRVTVPWQRPDVRDEADITEELVKLIGLDSLPSTLPAWKPSEVAVDTYWSRAYELRQLMKGLGLFEITTYPFISESDMEMMRIEDQPHLKLQNPRSQEQAYLRRSLLPQLLKSVVNNITIKDSFGMFEIASSFIVQSGQDLPRERLELGIIRLSKDARLQVKGDIDQVMRLLHLHPLYRSTDDNPSLHPARQATIEVDGIDIGSYGELHPKIVQTHKIDATAAYAEFDLDKLLEAWGSSQFRPQPKYPSSYRDLSLAVAQSVTWQQVRDSLSVVEDTVISFRSEFIRESDKVITIHVEMLAWEDTLDESQINQRLAQLESLATRDFEGNIES